MRALADCPPAPGDRQRLAARAELRTKPVMYQQWRDLLFLHWAYPAPLIQETLPSGLYVDAFDGKAFLGIVPFFMRNVRPRFLPAAPRLSNFMEMNLRTYVYDRAGIPGVWFYSLEANQPLAVAIARRFFHLPYQHAKMSSSRTKAGAIHYQYQRADSASSKPSCRFEYAPGKSLPEAALGSLEFFLIERYRLYASAGKRLWRGEVFHQPYPLLQAEVTEWNEELTLLNGFSPTGRPPDHILMSPGVDVKVGPLEQLFSSESSPALNS